MTYSSSLTDKEWEIIKPLLPKKKRTKPPTWSKRDILDGVFYQLKNGCNWIEGKSGFVPVKARWVIERSNSWMERCKSKRQEF